MSFVGSYWITTERIEAFASDHLGGRSVSSVLGSLPDVRADLVAERDALGRDGMEASVRARTAR